MSGRLVVKHADGLAPAVPVLAALLGRRSAVDALRPDWVLVQSRPMAQWLTLELARSSGACAGVEWLLPARFLERVFAAAGVEPPPAADPWRRDALAWRILAALPALTGSPAAAYAARGGLQAWQLASRVADLLDTWQLTRPDWIQAWQDGRAPAGCDAESEWFGALWRRLAADPLAGPSRAARVRTAVARLRAGEGPGPFPRALGAVLTGPLPAAFLELAETLAERADTALALVVAPSVHEHARATTRGPGPEGNRLLANLGLQGRRWQRALEERPGWEPQPVEGWRTRDGSAASVLATIQTQIAENTEPGTGKRLAAWDPAQDRSLRIHRCPGPMREAEVLRDELLRAFAELPGLSPGDVLVLVPDLTLYAPLVAAALESGRGTYRLGSVVSGASLKAADPVSAALLAIVQAAAGDDGRSAILALLDHAPIQERLGLAEADVEHLRLLLDRAGVACDRDAAARVRRLGLPPGTADAWAPGTWRHALDRLLAGYAVGAGTGPVGGVVPAAGSTAPDADLLGRWAQWWEAFAGFAEAMESPRPPTAWAEWLRRIATELVADPEGGQALAPTLGAIDAFSAAAGWCDRPIAPGVALAALEAVLGREAPLAPGLSGRIVVAGIAPFRAIPARVVALLGMSEAGFPRRGRASPWDPASDDPRAGERDPRADDRQLFLDAVLAARDRLIITAPAATDRGARVEPAPFSTCVDELIEAAQDALPTDAASLVIDAPLTPFSPRLLTPGCESWDQGAIDLAHRIATGGGPAAPEQPPFLPADHATVALPAPATETVVELEVAELLRFWRNPAAAWLAALGIRDDDPEEEPADEDPLDLGAYHEAGVLRRLVEAELAGDGLAAAIARERATGRVPLGPAGSANSSRLVAAARDLLHRAGLTAGRPHAIGIDLDLDLPEAVGSVRRVRLTGTVPGRIDGGVFRTWTSGAKPADHQLVGHRLRQLIVSAASGTPLPCQLAHRSGDETYPLQTAAAMPTLAWFCAGLLRGRCTPLPFFPATALAARKKGVIDAVASGLKAWRGDGSGGERDRAGIRVLWRGWNPEDDSPCWLIGDAVWSRLTDAPEEAPRTKKKVKA